MTRRGAAVRWSGEAPAKVNLRLEVLAREASGYHQIETVLQTLALADRIHLELYEEGGVELELTGTQSDALGPHERNLAVRAAVTFRSAFEAVHAGSPGVRIVLEKEVPHGAGLGGGSSDAAAVLRGLNVLADHPFTVQELMQLGGELGSDIPFFVSEAPRALARGRGDRILPLDPLPAMEVLLVVPPQPISTAWAYGVLAEYREGREVPPARESGAPASATNWAEVDAHARNDFEAVLFPLRPELTDIKTILSEWGARPALLSGSGAAVFGVFESEKALSAAETEVSAQVPSAQTIRTKTLARPSVLNL